MEAFQAVRGSESDSPPREGCWKVFSLLHRGGSPHSIQLNPHSTAGGREG